MKRFIVITLFLLPAFISSQAQTALQSGIMAAKELSNNFQLEKSDQLLRRLSLKHPENPEVYHLLARTALWRYLGSKDSLNKKNFFLASDKALSISENIISDGEPGGKEFYIHGWIYALRAAANTEAGNSLEALWAAKNAVRYFEECLKNDPQFYDAYLGLGFFEYALSFTPGIFQWTLGFLGLSADMEDGFDKIRFASEYGKIDQTDASYQLAKIYYNYYAEYDSSSSILSKLITKYPFNPLFNYDMGVVKLIARDISTAKKFIKKVIDLDHPDLSQTTALAKFIMGDIYFREKNWEKAIFWYDNFLQSTRSIDFIGIANYRSAISHFMIGENIEGRKSLLLAGNGNLDIFEDQLARERSIVLLDQEFDQDDSLLCAVQNSVYSGNYQEAVDICSEQKIGLKNVNKNSQLILFLAEAYYYMGDVERTLFFTSEVIKISSFDDIDDWILDYAHFLRAEVYLYQHDLDSSENEFQQIGSFDQFQYRGEMTAKVNRLQRKLNSFRK